MSFAIPRSNARLAGFSAGCDRLVHPAVTAADERAGQRRMIGVLLAAPFLLAAVVLQTLAGHIATASLLAGLCVLFGAGWIAALAVAASGRLVWTGALTLPAAAGCLGALVAAAGGPASPLALLAAAIAFESWWVRPSRESALAGGLAGVAALALAAAPGLVLPREFSVGPSAAQWIWPAAYAATVWLRLREWPARTTEADVQTAGERLEELLDAVIVRMSASGDVQDVSAQARRILNLPPELLLGSGLFERVHVGDRVGYLTAVADLREGASARRLEVRLRVPSEGEARAVYSPFLVELARNGEEIVAILRDHAEVAGLRDALACAQERAASDELAKSRFLAAVSHELRTPLNAIIGFSDMLLHEVYGGFTDPRQKEYAGLIRESGNHLLSVVTSILDVSKIESGAYPIHPEPFRFADAAAMCHSMMAHQAEAKAIRLEERVEASAGEIRADRRAVQQILINLVANAVKFTPEGGEVSLGARRLGSRLVFWVSDNGIGIAEEDLARLGQPFAQVQNDYTRRYDGAGLGLSLVKGLVSLHEGSLSIESAPGQGTTVTVTLPCDGPAGAERASGELAALSTEDQMGIGDEALRKTA